MTGGQKMEQTKQTSGYVTNMFYINVIVVGQNIFQVWNIPHSVHPILCYIFSTI